MNRDDLPGLALGVLVGPRATFSALAARPRPGFAWACGLSLGVAWAAFAGVLAAAGHRPTMDRGLPVDGEVYYATAAVYLTPLWVALTGLTAAVAHGVARALGGRGRWRASLSTVGPAYALPLLTLYLVPDMVAYAVGGHGALVWGVRVGLPIAAVVVATRVVAAVRVVHGVSAGRAAMAAVGAAVAQAVPFALLVR